VRVSTAAKEQLVKRWLVGSVIVAAALVASLMLTGVPGTSQTTAATYTPPRTPDGHPDLQGVWQTLNTAAWDLEDHAARLGVPAGKSVVEGGEIPYQPWALAKKTQNYEQRATLDPETKCYLPGVPRVNYMPFPFQIIQKPNELTFLYEFVHAVRYVFTTGKPHPPGPIEWWLGDSRGRWEGDTLVVDVIHFNDQTWFDRAGNFHSDALHLVERYALVGADHMSYEVTVEDPKVFTRPWKMSMVLYRHKEKNFQLLDYECYGFDFQHLYPFPQPGAPR
jgi:hypothetical protein